MGVLNLFLIQKGQRFIFGYTTAQLGRGKGGGPEAFCLGSNFFITTSSWTRALQYGQ